MQLISSKEAHCCNAIRENNTFNNSGPETVRGGGGGWVGVGGWREDVLKYRRMAHLAPATHY